MPPDGRRSPGLPRSRSRSPARGAARYAATPGRPGFRNRASPWGVQAAADNVPLSSSSVPSSPKRSPVLAVGIARLARVFAALGGTAGKAGRLEKPPSAEALKTSVFRLFRLALTWGIGRDQPRVLSVPYRIMTMSPFARETACPS